MLHSAGKRVSLILISLTAMTDLACDGCGGGGKGAVPPDVGTGPEDADGGDVPSDPDRGEVRPDIPDTGIPDMPTDSNMDRRDVTGADVVLSPFSIQKVQPTANPRGAAVLLRTENGDAVMGAMVGGANATISYRDANHVMVQIPATSALGIGTIELIAAGGRRSVGVAFNVLTAFPAGGPVGPTGVYIPTIPASGYLPDLPRRWVNQFEQQDARYFFDSVSEDADFIKVKESLAVQNAVEIEGSYDKRLREMSLTLRPKNGGAEEKYLGIFSRTRASFIQRMVLFPVSAGGPQLVLLFCGDSSGVEPDGGVDPDAGDPLVEEGCLP